MLDSSFRLNSQVSIRADVRGLTFYLGVGDANLQSYTIPWERGRGFVRWCRMHIIQRKEWRKPFSTKLDKYCGGKKRLGISRKLSEFLGVHHQTISNWRTGRYLPSDEHIEKTADFFGWDRKEALLDAYDELWQNGLRERPKKFSK